MATLHLYLHLHRLSHRLSTPFSAAELPLLRNSSTTSSTAAVFHKNRTFPELIKRPPKSNANPPPPPKAYSSAGAWFSGFGAKKKATLPEIVKAGDPVLHEPASDVRIEEIGLERIEKIVEDMIGVMRKVPGVGLAAPQIGIPLKVILNPKLKKKGNRTALFFEGCLSVDGFRAVVERHLEVEVTGLGRDGRPIKIDATGWQARILQHECDHLDGTIYVDKIIPRTFRTVENLDLPLPTGCPQLGVR